MNYEQLISNYRDRVFRIDTDCVLIFLGSSHLEKRPFLRIGASRKLTPMMSRQVSYIYLSNHILKHLLVEAECIDTTKLEEQTVIGSEVQVEAYKSILKESGIAVENLNYHILDEFTPRIKQQSFELELKDVFEEEAHPLVHEIRKTAKLTVLSQGSVFVDMGRNRLFDLNDLLHKEDSSENLNRQLNEVYNSSALNSQYERGFIRLQEHFVYYNDRKIYLSGLPDNYIGELNKVNIHPDQVGYIHHNALNDSVEVLAHRMHRSSIKPAILTERPDRYAEIFAYYGFTSETMDLRDYKKESMLREMTLRNTRVLIEDERRRTLFESKDQSLNVYYYHAPEEWDRQASDKNLNSAYKINQRPVKHGLNRAAIRGRKNDEDEPRADSHCDLMLIPEERYGKVEVPEDTLVMIYRHGRQKGRWKAKEKEGVYFCHPYINYRFTKVFAQENQLFHPLDLYLSQFILADPDLYQPENKIFVEAVKTAVEQFILRSQNFKTFLHDALNKVGLLRAPKNRYELLLLHNTVEFLRYLHLCLKAKDIAHTHFIEKVIAKIRKVKEKNPAIKMADNGIKGNINRFPDKRKYLFYNISDGIFSHHFPSQHELALNAPIGIELDAKLDTSMERKAFFRRYVPEVRRRELLNKLEYSYNQRAKIIEDPSLRFHREKERLLTFWRFLQKVPAYKKYEYEKFYLAVARSEEIYTDFERNQKAFDDLLADFNFTKVRPVKLPTPGQRRANQRMRVWVALVLLVLLGLGAMGVYLGMKFSHSYLESETRQTKAEKHQTISDIEIPGFSLSFQKKADTEAYDVQARLEALGLKSSGEGLEVEFLPVSEETLIEKQEYLDYGLYLAELNNITLPGDLKKSNNKKVKKWLMKTKGTETFLLSPVSKEYNVTKFSLYDLAKFKLKEHQEKLLDYLIEIQSYCAKIRKYIEEQDPRLNEETAEQALKYKKTLQALHRTQLTTHGVKWVETVQTEVDEVLHQFNNQEVN